MSDKERYIVHDWEVYDGDTVKCRIQVVETIVLPAHIATSVLGVPIDLDEVSLVLRGKLHVSVRVDGVDTPELRGEQKEAGAVAREAVERWLKDHKYDGIEIVFHCRDKYAGRSVADFESNGESLSEFLLEQGLAKPYDGGTKEPWTAEELRRIAGE